MSFLHMRTPFPPHHLPTLALAQTEPDRTRPTMRGPGSGMEPWAGTPPVMAVGWIPCLESFSRPWAPWIVLLNSEIGEKTRHSPSSGEVGPSDRLLSYPEGKFLNSTFPSLPPNGGEGSCSIPSVPHTTTSSWTPLSFAFSLPFEDPNL